MKRTKAFYLMMCLGLFSITKAQEGQTEFSVSQAVDYATQHNKTLQNSKDNIRLSDEQYKEARAAGLLQVEGSLDYMTYFGYDMEFSLSDGDYDYSSLIGYNGIDQGDVYILSLMSEPTTIEMSDQLNANLQVSQLIFSGQYWVGLKMAKLGKQMQEMNYSLSELDVKEQVINTYYLVLMSQDMLQILDGNVKSLEDILQHTNNMYKMGVAEQTDVDQLKVNESQLVNTRQQMERNLELTQNSLRILLGISPGAEFSLTDSLATIATQAEEHLSLSDSFLLSDNISYQLLSMQEELGEKQIDLEQWGYSPTIAAYYSYTGKIMTTGFDLTPPHVAGVTMSIPIYAGGEKKSKVAQKKIELDQVKRNKELIGEQLTLQNKQLLFELKNAYENYNTQKISVDVAKRMYKSYENKYKQGIISSLDLTQANNNLLQAESNYIQAILSLLSAKLSIDKLHNNI